MTKRILLALVLALLTFAPVAAAESFESPLAGVGDWLKEIAAAIAEMGGLVGPSGDEASGSIVPSGDPEPDGDGNDEMVGYIGPNGSPEPTNGDGNDGNGDDEYGGYILPNG